MFSSNQERNSWIVLQVFVIGAVPLVFRNLCVKKVPPPAPIARSGRDKGKTHYHRFPIGPKWTNAGECWRMARNSGCDSLL